MKLSFFYSIHKTQNKLLTSIVVVFLLFGDKENILTGQTIFRQLTEGTMVNTLTDSRSVNFADFNQDGNEDLLITQGNASGASDLIYLNKGNLTFELQSQWTNPIKDPSVGAAIADMNNDGLSDIYVATWYNKKNVLFKGTKNNAFEITQMSPNSYSESAVWGDYDNDGYLDLYVCNNGNNPSDNHNFIYKNNDGVLSLQSAMLCCNATLTSSVEVPLIDFAFIKAGWS